MGGVPVGGLHADRARARVGRALRGPLTEPLVVRAGARRFTLPAARIRARVNVARLVASAVTVSRDGWILPRTVHGLAGTAVHTDVPADVSYSHRAVERLTRRVAAGVERPARNAAVDPSAQGLQTVRSRTGVHVSRAELRAALGARARAPTGAARCARRW